MRKRPGKRIHHFLSGNRLIESLHSALDKPKQMREGYQAAVTASSRPPPPTSAHSIATTIKAWRGPFHCQQSAKGALRKEPPRSATERSSPENLQQPLVAADRSWLLTARCSRVRAAVDARSALKSPRCCRARPAVRGAPLRPLLAADRAPPCCGRCLVAPCCGGRHS